MDLNTNRDSDGKIGKRDQERRMDMDIDTNKVGNLDKTKNFVQAVLNKRRMKLNMPIQLRTESAPTSPASNIGEEDLVWDELENRSVKRRRGASFSSYTMEHRSDDDEGVGSAALAAKARRILRGIGRETKVIADFAKERNTKREIKDAANALESMVSQIQTSEVQALLQMLGRHQEGSEVETTDLEERLSCLQEMNKELLAKIKALEEEGGESGGREGPSKKDWSARLERAIGENRRLRADNVHLYNEMRRLEAKNKTLEEAREMEGNWGRGRMRNKRSAVEIIDKINSSRGFDDFKETLEIEWPEEAFKVVTEREGNPLKEERELNLAVLGRAKDLWSGGANKQIGERSALCATLAVTEPTPHHVGNTGKRSKRRPREVGCGLAGNGLILGRPELLHPVRVPLRGLSRNKERPSQDGNPGTRVVDNLGDPRVEEETDTGDEGRSGRPKSPKND